MAVELFIRCRQSFSAYLRRSILLSLQGLITDLTLTLREERSYAAYTRVVYLKEKKPKANHFGNGHLVFVSVSVRTTTNMNFPS